MIEVVINLKIFDEDSEKLLWEDNCLIQKQGTIKSLVNESHEKFVPQKYKKLGALKLRNVTVFSEKFGLEVSVIMDNQATDATKYTANFLLLTNEPTEQQPESSSAKRLMSGTSKCDAISSQKNASAADFLTHAKQELDQVELDLKQKQEEFDKKIKLLMKTEKDVRAITKQRQSLCESVKQMQNELDCIKNEVCTFKEERRKLDDEIKSLREKTVKKEKRLEYINNDLEKLEKKKRGSEQQLEVYKKDLNDEMDQLNKIVEKKENMQKEFEALQAEKEKQACIVEELRNDEKRCKLRIEMLQQEEKSFHLMLQELREQLNKQEEEKAATTDNQRKRLMLQGLREQSNKKTIATDNQGKFFTEETFGIHRKAFTLPCMYFNTGGCWRGDKCTYIHNNEFRTSHEQSHGNIKKNEHSNEWEALETEQQVALGNMTIYGFGEGANTNDIGYENQIQGAGTSTQIQLNTTDNGVNMQRMDDPSAQKHNTFSASHSKNEFTKIYSLPDYIKSQKKHEDIPRFFAYNDCRTQKYFSNKNWTRKGNYSESNQYLANDESVNAQLFVDSSKKKNGNRKRNSVIANRHSHARYQISPIRNKRKKDSNDMMPSTSLMSYSDRPRSNDSLMGRGESIVDRITIDGVPKKAKNSTSTHVHSRVTYEEK